MTITALDLASLDDGELDDEQDRAVLEEAEALEFKDRRRADEARARRDAVIAERARRADEREHAERLARASALRTRKRAVDKAETERKALYDRYVAATEARKAGVEVVQAALDALVEAVGAQLAHIDEQHQAWTRLFGSGFSLGPQGRAVLVDVIGHALNRAARDGAFHRSHRPQIIHGATLPEVDSWAWATVREYEPGPEAVAFEAERQRGRVPASTVAEEIAQLRDDVKQVEFLAETGVRRTVMPRPTMPDPIANVRWDGD